MSIMGNPRTLNICVLIDRMVGGETLVDECYSILPDDENEKRFIADFLRELAAKVEHG